MGRIVLLKSESEPEIIAETGLTRHLRCLGGPGHWLRAWAPTTASSTTRHLYEARIEDLGRAPLVAAEAGPVAHAVEGTVDTWRHEWISWLIYGDTICASAQKRGKCRAGALPLPELA